MNGWTVLGLMLISCAAGMGLGWGLTRESVRIDAHMKGYWQGREDESVLKEWTDE